MRAFAFTQRLFVILGLGSSVTPLMSPMQSTGLMLMMVACFIAFLPMGGFGR